MARKVFTYKDVEEAKKYIGKSGRFSNNLYLLETGATHVTTAHLTSIAIDGFPYLNIGPGSYQFFSPDPEPVEKWVPFTAEDWELFMGKPVKEKTRVGTCGWQITSFVDVGIGFSGKYHKYADALDEFVFMDGSPFGKKILTESTE